MNPTIDPHRVSYPDDEPLNRLFFAINRYVSTGDHIGEGVALNLGEGVTRIVIPVSDDPRDQQDLACLRSRLEETGRRLGYLGEGAGFEHWALDIANADMDALAAALSERPGPLGWGSGQEVIQQHFPGGDDAQR